MTDARTSGVVVDTMVISWLLDDRPNPLADLHDGDRWVAATAIRLGVPLVSHDRLFTEAPGLQLITAADTP